MIKRLARLLNYLDRGKNNFGSIQMPMTIMIFLGVYKDTMIGAWIFKYSYISLPIIILSFFAILTVIGYFEYKYKIIEKKYELENSNNPMMKRILEILEKYERN